MLYQGGNLWHAPNSAARRSGTPCPRWAGPSGSFIQGRCLHFLQFSAERVEQGLPQNAHFHKWIWPMFKLGPAVGAVLALIPLLLLRYPDALKLRVEEEMAERRRAVAGEGTME